ncbi:hypothetical protein FDZ60_04665 [Ehrlichia ruminantium]|nr:hypothetical protein FDZ60_04665 [Ehrlichia ruminantium]
MKVKYVYSRYKKLTIYICFTCESTFYYYLFIFIVLQRCMYFVDFFRLKCANVKKIIEYMNLIRCVFLHECLLLFIKYCPKEYSAKFEYK